MNLTNKVIKIANQEMHRFILIVLMLVSLCITSCGGSSGGGGSESAVYHTITFDANGGSWNDGEVIKKESHLSGMEIDLARYPNPFQQDWFFSHWEDQRGNSHISKLKVSSDLTLKAIWKVNPVVRVYGNGGTFSGGEAFMIYTVDQNSTFDLSAHPLPVFQGYTFKGWYNSPTGGSPLEPLQRINASVDYYAQWDAVAVDVFYNIVFDADGGKWSDGDSSKSYTIKAEDKINLDQYSLPERLNMYFIHWVDSYNVVQSSIYNVLSDMTFKAVWADNPVVTLDAGEGVFLDGQSKAYYQVVLNSLFDISSKELPVKPGAYFTGWYSAPQGGVEITAPHSITESLSYYARWAQALLNTEYINLSDLRINSNGDKANRAKVSVNLAAGIVPTISPVEQGGIKAVWDNTLRQITVTAADSVVEGVYSFDITTPEGSGILQVQYSTTAPYNISTPEELNYIRYNLDKEFQLTNNIYMPSGKWEPIGDNNTGTPDYFIGKLHGNGYTISGLMLTSRSTDAKGLFGYIGPGGVVDNLTIHIINPPGTGTDVGCNRNSRIGALAGYAEGNASNKVILSNIHVSGYLSTYFPGGRCYMGGMLGRGLHVEIDNSTSTVEVRNVSIGESGGFAAALVNAKVSSSYAGGSVTGTHNSGGFAGTASTTKFLYSYGDNVVKGNGTVGGIAGMLSSNSIVEDCYTLGDIYGGNRLINTVSGGRYVGGIAGHFVSGTIIRTYVYGNIMGEEYVSSIGGRTSGTISDSIALSSKIEISEAYRIGTDYTSSPGTYINNYARSDMMDSDGIIVRRGDQDGEDVLISVLETESFCQNLWSNYSGVWKWDDVNKRPILQWQDSL